MKNFTVTIGTKYVSYEEFEVEAETEAEAQALAREEYSSRRDSACFEPENLEHDDTWIEECECHGDVEA